MAIDIAEYKTLYIKTARDLITIMQQALIGLKENVCDKKLIADFHRAAHSFKSQSLVMGYTQSGLAAKMLEDMFRDTKDHETCVTEKTIPHIQNIVNQLGESVTSIETQGTELNIITSIPVV